MTLIFFQCVYDKTKGFYTITVIITPFVGKGIQIKTINIMALKNVLPPCKITPLPKVCKRMLSFSIKS